MRLKISIVPALLWVAGPAVAEEIDYTKLMLSNIAGTQSVSFEPQSQGGTLIGCNLVFESVHQDWKYRSGAFIKISGTFGIMGPDGKFAAVQKVVVNEMQVSKLPVTLEPSPPSRVYMRDAAFQSNIASLVNSYESDTPGALFAVFNFKPTFDIVVEALQKGEVIIGFNQFGGLSDIEIPIALDVVSVDIDGNRKRSPVAVERFTSCLIALSGR